MTRTIVPSGYGPDESKRKGIMAAGRPKKEPVRKTNDEYLEEGIIDVLGLKPGGRAKTFDRSFVTRFHKEHAPSGDILFMALIAKHAK